MITNKDKKVNSLLLIILSILLLNRCAVSNPSSTNTITEQTTDTVSETEEIPFYNPVELMYENKTYIPSIKTVRLFKLNWEMGDPLIMLGSTDQLEMHWDELAGDYRNFQYRIIHCTKDWEKSSLNEMEYLDGFNDNYVEYYEKSFNTFQNYVHYAVAFPNDQVSLRKSGNYIIMIYPEGKDDQPVITRRFYVAEPGFTLEPNIGYPSSVDDRYYMQEVDYNIYFNPQEIVNPYTNVHTYIEQNHREDNMCYGLEPNFVKENQLVYNYDEKNVFEGGNEFRNLDLTTYQSKTAQVREFQLIDDTIHAIMLKDIKRQFKKYLQYEDINGRYIIKTLNGQNFNLEAQYIKVHFNLPYETPLTNGDIYLFGELSDYQIKKEFKMTYDAASKTYVGNVLLKQGFYNYNYLFVPDNGPSNFETVEGTHFDTENEYLFRVYYSDPQNFYDRLMLYEIVKSRN